VLNSKHLKDQANDSYLLSCLSLGIKNSLRIFLKPVLTTSVVIWFSVSPIFAIEKLPLKDAPTICKVLTSNKEVAILETEIKKEVAEIKEEVAEIKEEVAILETEEHVPFLETEEEISNYQAEIKEGILNLDNDSVNPNGKMTRKWFLRALAFITCTRQT
jgi:hypothetical protein